jgi:hydroxyacylglutathione hydrolase
MYLERFYDEGLAHASYLVGCQATGEAIVIDASRHTEPYHRSAKAQGLTIVAATETHIHADYTSGTRQIAHEAGAVMYLSGEGGPDWSYAFARPRDVLVKDGDVIKIGNLSLKVLHTPGHTPEHIAFMLTDHPASDQPMGVFTGDFLFVGDVGRPDLLERAAGFKDTMRAGAQRLFQSLQSFSRLPDHLQIWPAHGAGSACGKALGAVPSSVLGFEKLSNWAFRIQDEAQFVEAILEGQPEPPKYFAQMKRINKEGPALLGSETVAFAGVEDLKTALEAGEVMVDLRGPEAFAQAHLKDSLFLPAGKALANWAGWVLSYQQPFSIIVAQESDLAPALRSLRSIGLDNIKAAYSSQTLRNSALPLQSSARVRADEVDFQNEIVIDVRSAAEFAEGHLPEARNIHVGYLLDRLDEIPPSPLLHCKSGMRSLIASSILARAGKSPRDVLGGYQAILSLSLAAV